jgi:DNA repair protein RecO (recombination protein O)
MLETAERFTPIEKEPLIRQFLLLVGGLRALGERVHDPRLVLDAYLLRTLAVAGYAPALDECAVCGTPDSAVPRGELSGTPDPSGAPPGAPEAAATTGSRSFAVAAGGLTCRSCRPPGAASPAVATIALMRALLRGEWDRADASQPRHQVECSSLVAAYVQWHLEHSIRSLRHVEHV